MGRSRMIRNSANTGNILVNEPWWTWPRCHRKGRVAWWTIAWRLVWMPVGLTGACLLGFYTLAVKGRFEWPG